MMKSKNSIHIPVLANEIIENLSINPSGTYIDCTAGFGGHSSLILNKLNKGRLICLDQDPNAIKHLKKIFQNNKNVKVIQTNFNKLDEVVTSKVDGIIFDLGVSSLMFDDPNRGFSYKLDGPLDMRMNPSDKLDARAIINTYTREQLIRIFKQYAEDKNPKNVVDAIIKYRELKEIKTTHELSNIICDCFNGSWKRKHPAKVYFQALRIEVNKELNVLEEALLKAKTMLKAKGKIAVITFHSLEDRIVKNLFRQWSEVKDLYGKEVPIVKLTKPQFQLVNKKPILPSNKEITQNNRSHSAKLRIIQKI